MLSSSGYPLVNRDSSFPDSPWSPAADLTCFCEFAVCLICQTVACLVTQTLPVGESLPSFLSCCFLLTGLLRFLCIYCVPSFLCPFGTKWVFEVYLVCGECEEEVPSPDFCSLVIILPLTLAACLGVVVVVRFGLVWLVFIFFSFSHQ